MAIDSKYGRVTTERGTIGEDEPVVVFRAQDRLLTSVLGFYWDICQVAGSPQEHLDRIAETQRTIEQWQAENFTQVPRSGRTRPHG